MTTFNKPSNATSPTRQATQQGSDSTNAFPSPPENSTQWRPLIPKEGGLIQVDIGGHPPIPTGSKQSSSNLLFLAFFWFLNFRGHFEGLNEVFS
jgi:hypothetical protein